MNKNYFSLSKSIWGGYFKPLLMVAICILSMVPAMSWASGDSWDDSDGDDDGNTPIAWAHFDSDTKTLTFKYGADFPKDDSYYSWKVYNDAFKYGDWDDADTKEPREFIPWLADSDIKNNIENVVFDETFQLVKMSNLYDYFYDCDQLKTVKGLGFVKFTDFMDNGRGLKNLFHGCKNLTSIDFTGFDTSMIDTMEGLFEGCSSLSTLDLKGFSTANVISMANMFQGCSSLEKLDLTRFNTGKTTEMAEMFKGCSNLENIYVSSDFTTDGVQDNGKDMFADCPKLQGADEEINDRSSVNVDKANYLNGYFRSYFAIVLGNGYWEMPLYSQNGKFLQPVSGIGTNYQLEDNLNYTCYAPFACDVNYTHTVNNDWGTLCTPFNITIEDIEGYDFYKINMLNSRGDELILQKISREIASGEPVIYKRTDSSKKTLVYNTHDKWTVSDTDDGTRQFVRTPVEDNSSNGIHLVGAFTETEVPAECYVIANNKFWLASDVSKDGKSVWAKPFRAYIQPDAQVASQMARSIDLGGATTGINNIDSDPISILNAVSSGKAKVYDLSGKQLGDLQKGINIVKMGNVTKKIIIK